MGGSWCVIKTKKPRLFNRDCFCFLSTFHETVVSAFRPPRTQFHESFRLQFPFVFRQPQSLQLLLLARPCLSTFSGLPLSRPIAASASLSDPRCFRVLSSASVLGSDYSASVSSFPSLPDSASQWLPQCSALAFAPSVFPALSCLVSRAFAPGSGTQLRRTFPFALP